MQSLCRARRSRPESDGGCPAEAVRTRRSLQNSFVFLSASPRLRGLLTDSQKNFVAHAQRNRRQDSLASSEVRVRFFFSCPQVFAAHLFVDGCGRRRGPRIVKCESSSNRGPIRCGRVAGPSRGDGATSTSTDPLPRSGDRGGVALPRVGPIQVCVGESRGPPRTGATMAPAV